MAGAYMLAIGSDAATRNILALPFASRARVRATPSVARAIARIEY
jgi:hypothetical protein